MMLVVAVLKFEDGGSSEVSSDFMGVGKAGGSSEVSSEVNGKGKAGGVDWIATPGAVFIEESGRP